MRWGKGNLFITHEAPFIGKRLFKHAGFRALRANTATGTFTTRVSSCTGEKEKEHKKKGK